MSSQPLLKVLLTGMDLRGRLLVIIAQHGTFSRMIRRKQVPS